jgi:hypothetical protein
MLSRPVLQIEAVRATEGRMIARTRRSLQSSSTLESMVFVLDNYDSFTYNLVQYLGNWVRRLRCIATTS